MRTLIVEDDATSRLVLQTFLSKYGHCDTAVNGNEAITAFRAAQKNGQQYDLICMDIMMPEMDGQQAVEEIRAMEAASGIFTGDGAKIIMTSALDDSRNIVQSFQSLCDAYLFKPIDTGKLLEHIRAMQLV